MVVKASNIKKSGIIKDEISYCSLRVGLVEEEVTASRAGTHDDNEFSIPKPFGTSAPIGSIRKFDSHDFTLINMLPSLRPLWIVFCHQGWRSCDR